MVKISLCMIVKDEEKMLRKCLESVQKYVAEIIVIDTGSTDNTVEIAKGFGAKVIDFEWVNDFSKARNESIRHAKGDWILVVDADEQIVKWDDAIFEELERTEKEAFQIQIEHQKESDGHHHYATRLFRNHRKICYQNHIHENLIKDGDFLRESTIGTLGITLLHCGYQEEIMHEKNKDERNMKLLKEELKVQPNNRLTHLHLANQYLKMKDETNAIYHYKIATNFKKDKEMFRHAALKMIWALYRLKRYEELFETIREAKKMFPDYTDLYFTHGELLETLGHDEGAIIEYQKSLALGETTSRYYSKKGVGSIYPLQSLRRLYYRQFNLQKEEEIQGILFQNMPRDIEVANRFFEIQARHIGIEGTKKMIEMVYDDKRELEEVKRQLLLRWALRVRLEKEMIIEEAKSVLNENLTEGIHYLLNHGLANEVEDILRQKEITTYHDKLALAEYYFHQEDYPKTIQWASAALDVNNELFRPINLLMMSAKNLGDEENTKVLAKDMLKLIPHDEFFSHFK